MLALYHRDPAMSKKYTAFINKAAKNKKHTLSSVLFSLVEARGIARLRTERWRGKTVPRTVF